MTKESQERPEGPADSIPTARVKPGTDHLSVRSLSTRLWFLTAAALIVTVILVAWNQKPAGPTVTIRFDEGHGLRRGNAVQHRGIEVGTVTKVGLTADEQRVEVQVQLLPDAGTLARHGSEFWIVRPRVSLTKVSGLDTVVGARYIEVQPGPQNSEAKFEFDGLESPLSLTDSEAVQIEIRFQNGDGLSVGDAVRHRGIVVGEVTTVALSDDLTRVIAGVRLLSSADRLARAGSQFWVERPSISAVEIRGLETLIGGRYIAVRPGSSDSDPATSFDGLSSAPPGDLPEGGVEIVLEAGQRGGLRAGVPVLYRGQQVGHVIAVGLSSDAATVDARVWIDTAYRNLVRNNTRFWMNSGFDVSVGLNGLKLSAGALSSIVAGGVSFATPAQPGSTISTGHRFSCAAEADEEWLQWQARIPVGNHQITGDLPLPKPLRASLRWQEKRFGFLRDKQRSGWILPLNNGQFLGPANLFAMEPDAIEGTTSLEVAGETLELEADQLTAHFSVTRLQHELATDISSSEFPATRLGAPSQPVDCLVITSGAEAELSVHASRFRVGRVTPQGTAETTWFIDQSVPLTSDHHGACVVSRVNGNVVGLLHVDESGSRVALVSKLPSPQKSGAP